MPEAARAGAYPTSLRNNLGVVVTTFNDAVQSKGTKVPVDVARFATNLVFGIGGLIDVANRTQDRREPQRGDFRPDAGLLGRGAAARYIVLPLLRSGAPM